ncbi:hypothetical protein [Streptomyces sp. NPDC003247]|uniref:hypothetical protein n=1 Tax=Streptomyces sp. NPDC003247 TaxID=3364677 RepID=UPI0036CD8ED8
MRANGTPVVEDPANPDEAKAEVPAGTVRADVVPPGTDTVAIGPADLDLAADTSTVAYAWGSADDRSRRLKIQTFDEQPARPGRRARGAECLPGPRATTLAVRPAPRRARDDGSRDLLGDRIAGGTGSTAPRGLSQTGHRAWREGTSSACASS